MITTELSLVLVAQASNKANVVSQMTAVILATELIAPPLGAALMTVIPWIPFLASSAVTAIVNWELYFFSVIHHRTESASTTHQPVREWHAVGRI